MLEMLSYPSVSLADVEVMFIQGECLTRAEVMFIQKEYKSWIGPTIHYLDWGNLLLDRQGMTKLIKELVGFTFLDETLYN